MSRTAPTVFAAVVALVAAACGAGSTSTAPSPTGPAATEVTITMTEFAFRPDRIEVPAGTTVTVTLRNEGQVAHEWMVGRQPEEEGGYGEDLLARMDPEVVAGHGYTLEGVGGEEHEASEAAGEHGHAGARVTVEPGGEVTLRLHVPADAVGEWETGCFIPGHYQAGMRGTLVVVGADGAAAAPAVGQPATARPVTIEELSRPATDLPDSPDYRLYRDGRWQERVPRDGPMTHEVHFTIVEGVAEVLPGTSMEVWTFDGAVPGPMIRARVGDTIDFFLHNPGDSHLPHNVDFHAVTGPGGGAVVLDTTPGATSELVVRLLEPGIYIYHCAFPPVPTHIALGMYGLIVVEPEEGLPPVDHEFYVVQSEWYTTAGADRSAEELHDAGHLEFDVAAARREEPTFVVFNGRPGALTGDRALGADGSVRTGQRVRLFVGNAGPNLISSFHVIGEIFETVYVEGSFTLTNQHVQTTLVPAGGAAGVEFTVEVPGTYVLVDHAIFRIEKGALGQLVVAGEERPDVFRPVTYSTDARG